MRKSQLMKENNGHTPTHRQQALKTAVTRQTAPTETPLTLTTTTIQSHVHVAKCRFSHNGPQNFKDETNPGYAKKPYYLNGKMCVFCKGLITHEGKGGRTEEEGQIFIKPTRKHPVWACLGVPEKSCDEVLCSACFQRKFLK